MFFSRFSKRQKRKLFYAFLLLNVLIIAAVFGVSCPRCGLKIDPLYPSLVILGVFVASAVLFYIREEMLRKQIRNAFGMYVAEDVMKTLERNPEKLKLGGENRELSVMFMDIRNFTGFSEGMPPEKLIQVMNVFFTRMSDIVMAHEGTLDKYIGDEMMCFWNAPRDVKNHERKACVAALEMLEALKPVNEMLRKREKEEGAKPFILKVGIGINAGVCAVGNMGSRQRFAYSALGDVVNLASRLEGQSKYYGIDIIISKDVYEKVSDFATIELDKVRVKGKDNPVVIYGLLGDEMLTQEEYFKNWKQEHGEMLKAFRERRFTEALRRVETCYALVGPEYKKLYALYEERINLFLSQKDMLPDDWDGTIDADEK